MKKLKNVIYAMRAQEENEVTSLEPLFFIDGQKDDTVSKLSTVELCRTAINNIPQGGLSPDAMFKRLQILKKLSENKEPYCEINFEDSEFDVLKQCVNELKFSIVNANLFHFYTVINDLK